MAGVGRKCALDRIDLELFEELDRKLYNDEITKKEACKLLGITHPTFQKYHAELIKRVYIKNNGYLS